MKLTGSERFPVQRADWRESPRRIAFSKLTRRLMSYPPMSISHGSYLAWTKTVAEQKAKEQEDAIWELWLSCQTQEAIAEKLGVDQATVSRVSAEIMQKVNSDNLHIFRNFEEDESEKSGRRRMSIAGI